MKTTNLGISNVYGGLIKKAIEGYWRGEKNIYDMVGAEQVVLDFAYNVQSKLDLIPVGDIDIYDRLLRQAVNFGLVPKRFGTAEEVNRDMKLYLSIPRGTATAAASPMVKWFNNNYHVVQPEIEQNPLLISNPKLPNLNGNKKLALIGPWTFLSYSINKTNQSKEDLFGRLSRQYVALINSLPDVVVQLEEPSFLTDGIPEGYREFLGRLQKSIHLHVYFGAVNDFADELFDIDIQGIGLDFVDGESNLELLSRFPSDKILIAGIINGRNVRPVTTRTKETLETICDNIPDERLYISPSCSLMHVPISAENEEGNFSFAIEKLKELEGIKNGTISY